MKTNIRTKFICMMLSASVISPNICYAETSYMVNDNFSSAQIDTMSAEAEISNEGESAVHKTDLFDFDSDVENGSKTITVLDDSEEIYDDENTIKIPNISKKKKNRAI